MGQAAKKHKWLRRALAGVSAVIAVGLLLVLIRAGYSLTESGRIHRLLNALQGHKDGIIDATLTRVGLLPPLPEGWSRDLVMFDMLKSIRSPTPDEYALLLDNERLRYTAIIALETAGDARVIRPLFVDWRAGRAFDNQLPDLRERLGDKPFLELLNDPDAKIRVDVVEFLSRGRPRDAGDPLAASFSPLLDDPDTDVRIAAAEFLAARGNPDGVSCLLAEFNRLAADGREERNWLKQAHRGEIAVDEFTARRSRLGRLVHVLQHVNDGQAAEALRAYAERAGERKVREKTEFLAGTFGPEDRHWELYAYLITEPVNLGYYHATVTADYEESVTPPFIVPAQRKARPEEISSKFGEPAQKDLSAVWEIQFAEEERIKANGLAWIYGSEIEILFVDEKAAWVKTGQPEARALRGGPYVDQGFKP